MILHVHNHEDAMCYNQYHLNNFNLLKHVPPKEVTFVAFGNDLNIFFYFLPYFPDFEK
jgi:hypothetical protein